MPLDNSYGTTEEIRFIEDLGQHTILTRTSDQTVEELYENYISSCSRRHDWGEIDKTRCMRRAKMILRLCQKKAA